MELVSGVEELIAAGSFLVVEYENKIIGCGGWAIDAAESQKAEIRSFFVHPDYARRGVATPSFLHIHFLPLNSVTSNTKEPDEVSSRN